MQSILHFIQKHKVYIFPAIIICVVLILAALKISGTSIGIYHDKLYGDQKDSALLLNQPRAIRSDEWDVNTPFIISQVTEGMPRTNDNIGNGQDISITFDTPYADWSTLFKPHNWAFFVLPLDHAFALKWWLIGALVLIGGYAFTLRLLPKKYLLASLLSIAFFCSPFIQWWYQAGTLLPIAYGIIAATLVLAFLQSGVGKPKQIALLTGLGYTLTCFALLLYIPFLLPIAVVIGAFILGHILNASRLTQEQRRLWKKMLLIGIPVVAALLIAILFIKDHSSVFTALQNSVYPGQRTEPSGGYPARQLFGGYFNLQLQDDARATHYNFNQSEASSFILIFPFLIPLFIYLWQKTRRVDWRVLLLGFVFLVFCIRLFIPFVEPIFDLIGFNRIPHNRLIIGLGILNFLLIVIGVERLMKLKKELPFYLIALSIGLAFLTVLLVGIDLKTSFDGYLESPVKILLLSAFMGLVVWLLLKRWFIAGIASLALFSFISIATVHPLYRGLDILTNSQLVKTLKTIGDKDGKWVVGDYAAFMETIPTASGINTLSGVYAYPQLSVWRPLGTGPHTQTIYNRYAHVFFTIEPVDKNISPQQAYLDPPALDAFRVHADACSSFLKQHNVRYVLVTTELQSPCLEKLTSVAYPAVTFQIYKIRD